MPAAVRSVGPIRRRKRRQGEFLLRFLSCRGKDLTTEALRGNPTQRKLGWVGSRRGERKLWIAMRFGTTFNTFPACLFVRGIRSVSVFSIALSIPRANRFGYGFNM